MAEERFYQKIARLFNPSDFLYSFFLGFIPSLLDITTDFSFADRLQKSKRQKNDQTNTSQIGKRRRVDRIRTGLCCDHGALHGHRHHWAHKDLGKQPRVSRSHPPFDYSRLYHKNRNTPKCLMIQYIVFQGASSF